MPPSARIAFSSPSAMDGRVGEAYGIVTRQTSGAPRSPAAPATAGEQVASSGAPVIPLVIPLAARSP